MSKKISVEVFDERKCYLGEGPTSSGPGNNHVMWVNILENQVMWRNLETGITGGYDTTEHVSFAIPRTQGGEVLGTVSGPVLRDSDGTIQQLPTRSTVPGDVDNFPTRWNDAKVSRNGDLILGTMTYDVKPDEGALYRYAPNSSFLERIVDDVTISNGMDWSSKNDSFFYIDTMKLSIDKFDLAPDGRAISNRKAMWTVPEGDSGLPDGMSIDAEDGLWVAFWGGSVVRRFDKDFTITAEINIPTPYVTSCVFAGPELDTLIITTAHNGEADAPSQAGMTFICKPGVKGVVTNLFPM
jgi:sugar lactone lactonase YvrE